MITKKDYLKAKEIVEQYEQEHESDEILFEMAKKDFPIGTFVESKLDSSVYGTVIGYGMWRGIMQLICENDGKKTRILIHNAVAI